MLLPPPVLSRTDALFPSTTLFLSAQRRDGAAGDPLLDRLRPRALARRPDPVRSGLSGLPAFRGIVRGRRDGRRRRENDRCGDAGDPAAAVPADADGPGFRRSEDRRVGKECWSTVGYELSAEH